MNKYTIDTHALIWYLIGSKKISKKAIEAIDSIVSGKATGYISVALLLEMLWIIKIKDERLRGKDPNHPKITGLNFENVLSCLKEHKGFVFIDIGR